MDLVPFARPRLWKSKADFFRPFRNAAADAGENINPLYDPAVHRTEPVEPDLSELNTALAALVDIFPDVRPEVFREMLVSISDESRLQVVTEHLLAKKAKWARGRYRTPQILNVAKSRKRKVTEPLTADSAFPEEDTFRSDSYKKAVKQVCYQEFKSLNHSSIKAILAEQNFSYTLARPSLQHLSTKPWRFSLSSFWTKRSPSAAGDENPYIIWQSTDTVTGQAVPAVKRTGSAQLDQELYELFVAPALEKQREQLLAADYKLATQLNSAEAEAAEALFECECCYDSVPFESISTCDDGCHQLCFDCVRRTVSEALYGQGWARAVSLERSTVRCFAPTANACQGIIPASELRHALSQGREHEDLWIEFQERTTYETLAKSRLPLQRCPFCSYVEVKETPRFRRRKAVDTWHHVTRKTPLIFQMMAFEALLIFTVPLLLCASVVWLVIQVFPTAGASLDASWERVHKQRRGLKFRCLSPICGRTSCMRCLSNWRDPHACFENEKTSLRTAIESSATAAVKRTCPKCLLSFVKSSGCNKLVCNCGYTMCYICRQEITSREGYSHFCQHFRPSAGRCTDCDRCDLYGDEDEEAAIRRAAEAAEKAWKAKEGGKEGDERATQAMVEALVGQARGEKYWELWLDAVLDAIAA